MSEKLTQLLGTPHSIVVHTIFFALMFALVIIGWELDEMLLVLTTILSIEAIYLALFIQMTVNKTTQELEEVAEDIDEIQEDERNDDIYDEKLVKTLDTIQKRLQRMQTDFEYLKKRGLIK